MATLAPKGTYVFLDDAALWVDYSTGRLHITSNDKDVPEGVHLSVRPGTKTDDHLRDLLKKFNVPVSAAERDERRRSAAVDTTRLSIDHSQHGHPLTPQARAACRRELEQKVENATSFQRLPVPVEPHSAHHHNTVTWSLMYPTEDADLVAEMIEQLASWSGRETVRIGDETSAELTYGPVWGGYNADLLRIFRRINVEPAGISKAKRVCEPDCTHPSHS